MSDDPLKRAASKDKNMHIVEGANHMQLYDGQTDEAVSVLGAFFKRHLLNASAGETRGVAAE
ncbi:MAG TPA: hypothetical protein VE690_04635 [Rhodopila sp.]|nr:hypothetical protein [Rhodopila sp.]